MANLKVSIVVRVTDSDGNRNWVPATGTNDPQGPYYLRYYKGSKPKHVKAGRFYDEAEAAKVRLERKLKAASIGLSIPQRPGDEANLHHWRDCLHSYISTLRTKTKRNGWKYKDKSIREREANILEFAQLTAKPYVEHYTAADMLRYKEHLYALGRANDTVLNKLSCIVTWLKRNGLVSIVGLLPGDERPERRETEGHPYSREKKYCAGIAGVVIIRYLSGPKRKFVLEGDFSHGETKGDEEGTICATAGGKNAKATDSQDNKRGYGFCHQPF